MIPQDMAISLRNIEKIYKLYDRNFDRLKESILFLGKQYHRKFNALKNVSFDVKKGEVLGIIGKNGAGKSTLLNIVAGVLTPSSGKIQTRGKIAALLGIGAGFNPELTGVENIHLNGIFQGFSREEMDAKMDEILSFADIGDFAYQPIKIYSTGMQSRLAFAVAINVDPDILIVDEVLAVGDELFRRKCYAKIENFMEEEKTILFVTHGVNTVNELCTRAILLDLGELILEGPPILVTRYYNKLLYAGPKDKAKIRVEIDQLNRDKEKKKAFERMPEKEKGQDKLHEAISDKVILEDLEIKPKAFFIPNFSPKSTLKHRYHDVDVFEPQIETLSGEKVNALVMNEEYVFSCKARFNQDAEEVKFSMLIQNEKGISISGITIPEENRDGGITQEIKKGETYLFQIKFKCALLPDVYYISVSIFFVNEEMERIILTRVGDIVVFKVIEEKELNFWGSVHLAQSGEITKLKE
jgi:lipopolysaccharide transport system ATP-binding protein